MVKRGCVATIGLVAAATAGAALSAQDGGLAALGAGEYSVSVTGTVAAEASALSATNGDADVTDAQLRERAVAERARFTGDTFHKPESGPSGPFEVTMALGPEYVSIDGVDQPALSVGLHFGEGIEPGTYEVTDGFIDVGPNAAPVAVMVAAASADRKQTFLFSWKVEGSVTLAAIDREKATGHFRFRANRMNREGRVTDDRVTASGAFKAIPFTPEADLPDR